MKTPKKILRRYISEFVYGAVDGTVTTFAVVAASAGAGISSAIVLVLGVANLLADGFSMGSSAYLAAEAETTDSPRQTSRRASPKIIGLATFGAFVVVGSVPVLPYVFDVVSGAKTDGTNLFVISAIGTVLTFAGIGYIKGRVSEHSPIKSVVSTVLLGVIAASLAYVSGNLLASWLGVEL